MPTRKRNEAIIHVISGPKQLDSMMHAFDVFEPSKRLATLESMKISYEGPATLKVRKGIVHAFKQATEQTDHVVAIFFEGDKKSAFIDPTVQTISDGKKFTLLRPILEQYGVA